MNRLLLFACKRGRPRDLPLLKAGARAAGYRFLTVVYPLVYPVLLMAALLRLFKVPVRVIISDHFPADGSLAQLFGNDAARMFWNYADEFPDRLQVAPFKRVCFFGENSGPVRLFRFAPQPLPRSDTSTSSILFVGDVSLSCNLPQGNEWWAEQLEALAHLHGWAFYLTPQYEALLTSALQDDGQRRRARVLTKNILRLWIVRCAHRHFGTRLNLVGSNWRPLGLASQPSIYDANERLALYGSTAVNLDAGSKSGSGALYPRSSEIISVAGPPVQVICADSHAVYGARVDEIAFVDEASLASLIETRLSESVERRAERTSWLASHLAQHQLTMSDSWRLLFDGGSDAFVGHRSRQRQPP